MHIIINLQSVSLLKPHPFLTISSQLTFSRSASIQLTTEFHSDVRHSTDIKICHFFNYIVTLSCHEQDNSGITPICKSVFNPKYWLYEHKHLEIVFDFARNWMALIPKLINWCCSTNEWGECIIKLNLSVCLLFVLSHSCRDLPQYGHKQWQSYFGRTFDIYTKLWKFQQQHRSAI